ncbi:zinc ribbon domain-containing protein [Thermogemmatispora sp.]|uniref:zinc ribbon domain-containing protein n=1 Tax=Thermogemmatispora sp. TaxID=1968838 RepID=UPI0035E40216
MNAQSLTLILGATPGGGSLLTTLQNALGFIVSFFLAFFFVFWISLIIWTFRDIRSRSQDLATQVIATLLVAVFNVGGLLIYLILRPRQTLAEIYERQLEEESLLAEMTERQTCTNCHARVESDFQICPSCGQKLKRPCPKCERLLELRWSFCPYCATNLMGMPMQGMPSVPGVSGMPGVPSMPGVAGMPANQPPGVPMSGPLGGNRF